MRKLIVGAFVSLDGVMQAPGGPEEDPTGGFTFGGWVAPHFDEQMGAAIGAMFEAPFDLLLGRKTYDIFAAHWPHVGADDPMGQLFDRITKYVATRNAGFKADWQNSEVLAPEAIGAVRALKAGEGPNLVTQGSGDFLKSLFAAGLVDEINTFTFPVVLGKGKRLFGDGAMPAGLKLVSSSATPSGIVVARYQRSGDVPTGSFALEEPTDGEIERRKTLD